MMERKARGQCFRCGEKYHPLHKYANRQLRVLILGDDEETSEDGDMLALEVEAGKWEETVECKEIGLCSIAGNGVDRDHSQTMRLPGKVGGIPLMTLIDSGASHNFISPEVVSGLSLKMDTTHQMGVQLGDGHRIKTQGRCSNIQIQLGDLLL